ncbi:hypothetical protein [Halomontanus rarus]|uniref:hypothetical protein n=1 Tax=Halomontanus rarus TaxID=3034020 RepID=UPI001A989000
MDSLPSRACGESTGDERNTTVGISKLSVLAILSVLVDVGFVERDGPRYAVDR